MFIPFKVLCRCCVRFVYVLHEVSFICYRCVQTVFKACFVKASHRCCLCIYTDCVIGMHRIYICVHMWYSACLLDFEVLVGTCV